MKKRLLYIHGYNGSPQGHSFQLFNRHKPDGWEVIGMDYLQDDCAVALQQIRTTILEEKIDAVTGSSLGGFLTLLTTGIERFVINPCYLPSVELPKLGPLNDLPVPSPDMIATYAAFEPQLKQFPASEKALIHGFFGDEDELLGFRYLKTFTTDVNRPYIVHSAHHVSESAVEEICRLLADDRRLLTMAHHQTMANEDIIRRSTVCGCISCERTFSPKEIRDWMPDKDGRTAICPYCSCDAVLGDASGYELSTQFLKEMHKRWF